ncbi:uncharacterized protein [Apostichopus japonicus]|uniref:uncharacterized protein n=1 Tax=Stichopus japonicus TaxID=307972 RepID=UPI003AB8A1D1
MKLGGLLLLVTLIIVFTNICCASSICNETQEATLFTTFEVECSLPNLEWISVIYHKEGHELIRYQKAKCEDSSGDTFGPRYEDGTLHITDAGALVFNNIFFTDSTNYQLEYIDCDGGSYPQYTDNFYISVHNVEEPTTAPFEGSTTSSHSSTPDEPATASSESSTTSSKPNTSGGKTHIWIIIVVIIIIVVVAVVAVILWTKSKAQGSTTPAGRQGEGNNDTTEEIALTRNGTVPD